MEVETAKKILARLIIEEHRWFIHAEQLALKNMMANSLEPWPIEPEEPTSFGDLAITTECEPGIDSLPS